MLLATIVAAGGGVLVGFVRGGRLERLAQVPIRLAWLAAVAWLVQVVLFVSPLAPSVERFAAPIHLATVILLAVVIFFNRGLPGFAVLGIGLGLNAIVYAANGGFMPVSESALIAAGNASSISAMADGARFQKTILLRGDTPLWFLGDILPLPMAGKVYSVGDVVAGIGLFALIAGGMLRTPTAGATPTLSRG